MKKNQNRLLQNQRAVASLMLDDRQSRLRLKELCFQPKESTGEVIHWKAHIALDSLIHEVVRWYGELFQRYEPTDNFVDGRLFRSTANKNEGYHLNKFG